MLLLQLCKALKALLRCFAAFIRHLAFDSRSAMAGKVHTSYFPPTRDSTELASHECNALQRCNDDKKNDACYLLGTANGSRTLWIRALCACCRESLFLQEIWFLRLKKGSQFRGTRKLLVGALHATVHSRLGPSNNGTSYTSPCL